MSLLKLKSSRIVTYALPPSKFSPSVHTSAVHRQFLADCRKSSTLRKIFMVICAMTAATKKNADMTI